jgi:hypothetical protein
MQHLESARLAAFDHDPFTVDELAHLAVCASCRTERDAVGQLVALAAAEGCHRPDAEAPRLAPWESLAVALRREGLLTTGEHALGELTPEVRASEERGRDVPDAAPTGGAVVLPWRSPAAEVPASSRAWFISTRRAVAVMALLAGGAAMGRLSRDDQTPLPINAAGAVAQQVGFADNGFASVAQATDVLNRAQRDYERASLWLAANDSTERGSDVYRARLAALDQMMAASRAALREAPQDPVLNHYYIAAYTAREATLQQLGGTLPVDKVIERY